MAYLAADLSSVVETQRAALQLWAGVRTFWLELKHELEHKLFDFDELPAQGKLRRRMRELEQEREGCVPA